MKPNKCAKCGKEMVDKNGVSMTGISLTFRADVKATDEELKFYKKQIGKYELDRSYEFCWECWLDSLMGEPPFKT